MSAKRTRNHELPRHYLRDFCSPTSGGHIWVFERNRPFKPGKHRERDNPHFRGINLAALHPDGYGQYESALQQKEHAADDAIRAVRALQHIDASQKEILARYIGLTWRRLASREKVVRPLLEQEIKEARLDNLARQLAYDGRFGDARQMMETLDWVKSDRGKTDLLRKSMLLDHQKIHAVLMARPWRFVKAAPGQYFVTADSPVVFDRAQGLLASLLLFPIGRGVMLSANPTGEADLTYELATPCEVRKLNAMVIMQAHREIYSPYPDEWIHEGWHDGFVFTAQDEP